MLTASAPIRRRCRRDDAVGGVEHVHQRAGRRPAALLLRGADAKGLRAERRNGQRERDENATEHAATFAARSIPVQSIEGRSTPTDDTLGRQDSNLQLPG